MLQLTLPRLRPGAGTNPALRDDPLRRLAEWAFFLACLVLLAATVWGRIRTTGPATLAGCTALGWALGVVDRRAAARRLIVLLLAFAGAYLLRNQSYNLLAHRGGRLVLVAGLGMTTLLAIPSAAVAALTRLSDALARNPNGWRAVAVAAVGVVAPVTAVESRTSQNVWTGDTMPLVPTVVQLWTHGNRDLTGYLPGHGYYRWDVCGPDRPYFVREVPGAAGVYSTYPAGMEPFAWPGVLLADALGYDLRDDNVLLWVEKLSASALAGACLGLFFLAALHVGPPPAAFAVTWLLATGSVFTSTIGMILWQQGGVVFWSLLALWVELRSGGRPGWRGVLAQGVACGSMLACRPSAVTFLVPFGLWVLARDWRRGLIVPAVALLAYLPWAAMYYALYRNPFGPAMGFLNEQWFPGESVDGVLFSPGRGLFVYQPCLLLLGLRLWPPAGRHDGPPPPAGWAGFAAGMIAAHVVLVGSWPMWWGGFCYGSRLAAEVVPVAALFAVRPVGWLLRTRGGWVLVAVVALAGFAVHAPCAYYDAWLWNDAPVSVDTHPARLRDWSRPPFLYGLLPPR